MCGSVRAQPASDATQSASPTNVILLIPDGYGPASGTMARDYVRWWDGTASLALDSLHQGSVRTFAADSRITDSAASATAYSTGTKTNNGYVAVDTSDRPLGTLLEGVERQGMVTGLVATSRLTHATPAAFSAHTPDRGEENEIAAQQITKSIEVLLGGGRRHFLPGEDAASARSDEADLIAEAQDRGYQYVTSTRELASIDETPVLGLFADSHMAYEIDRPAGQPSLAAMTRRALDLLGDAENGFFLMVEASRVDHAGHANDAAAHLHDILAFNEAVETALDFAETDGETLVVSVSDHETGGLSLGRSLDGQGEYRWEPSVLDQISASHGVIQDSLSQALETSTKPDSAVVASVIDHFTAIDNLSPTEQSRLLETLDAPYTFSTELGAIIGKRAVIGWTTDGHTAVDVNLYAYGPGRSLFTGNRDNTAVGQALAHLLEVDLLTVTDSLRSKGHPQTE